MDHRSCLQQQFLCSYLVCKPSRRRTIASYDYGAKCSMSLHALITRAINTPSGRGSSVFVLFLLQKELLPWLCAIASFIFHLMVDQLLCRVEAATAPFLLVGGLLRLSRGAQERPWPTISAAFSSRDGEENAVNQVAVFTVVQSFTLSGANANQGSEANECKTQKSLSRVFS